MRLDGEVRDHWKLVDVVDDEVRLRGVHIAPAEMQLVEHVGVAPRVVGSKLRFLHERGLRVERGIDCVHAWQHLVLDANQLHRGLGRFLRPGHHGRHRLPVVLRLADREDRLVVVDGSKPGHRAGKIRGREYANDVACGSGCARIDRSDPRVAAVEVDELHVKHLVEADVGDELLIACRPRDPAGTPLGGPDRLGAHGCKWPAATTASQICT